MQTGLTNVVKIEGRCTDEDDNHAFMVMDG
jgi:hypothetical protein